MEIGFALIEHVPETMEIRGRDLVTGLPKTIRLQSNEIQHAMRESLLHILEAIRATLEDCPPELSGDIVDRGVVLTGGARFKRDERMADRRNRRSRSFGGKSA